jgi:hypothetical protein
MANNNITNTGEAIGALITHLGFSEEAARELVDKLESDELDFVAYWIQDCLIHMRGDAYTNRHLLWAILKHVRLSGDLPLLMSMLKMTGNNVMHPVLATTLNVFITKAIEVLIAIPEK